MCECAAARDAQSKSDGADLVRDRKKREPIAQLFDDLESSRSADLVVCFFAPIEPLETLIKDTMGARLTHAMLNHSFFQLSG